VERFLAVRLAKIVCVGAVALFMALVAFGNVTDPATNFTFVKEVLDMDDIPGGAAIRWRAVTSPLAHQIGYIAIIVTEIAVAALTALGALAMIRARKAAAPAFQRAKNFAILGLTLGFLLYEAGFIAIAGEWFGMWRSPEAGAVQSAFRVAMTMLGLLIFISLRDEDETTQGGDR
jgi:predicted small integral membrane protein